MALLKSDLKICFKHIKVRDYNLKHTVMCYEFKKLNKENGDIYGIRIPYEKGVDGFFFYFPYSYVYLKEIEERLSPLYKKYEIFTHESLETLCDITLNHSNIDKDIFGLKNTIVSIEAFDSLKNEIQRVIDDYSLPFIDKYNNIENVAELINGLKTCEVWQCVNNQGNAYIRAALILKKARHSSFKNKLIEYYEFYREIYKERLIKYGECHHLTKDGYNIILAFNELFCLELESLGYKIDHIWEK
ncbi:MAG: hypothetical protein MJZ28_10345 [Paludibacteraceae bacterium]|nr:hypothetical protein [Paludibacteraceae bacterium]